MHYIRYKETKQRGTLHFPIEYYHVNSRHPQYTMPYHWHEEIELIRILSGTLEVTLEETSLTAGEGDFLIINSGVLHSGIPDRCVYECMVFDTGFLGAHPLYTDILHPLEEQKMRFSEYYPAKDDEIHASVRRLFHAMSGKQAGYELITLGALYEVFGHIVSGGLYTLADTETVSVHRHVALLKQSLRYMEQHYSEKITLDELARTAGLSPKYFCRFFQEMTRRTPMDYLNYYRIERACFLLVNTDHSITEISFDCGFRDLSYFIKTFKRYKGTTPKQYLKEPI